MLWHSFSPYIPSTAPRMMMLRWSLQVLCKITHLENVSIVSINRMKWVKSATINYRFYMDLLWGDYKFYGYSECQNFSKIVTAFTKCTIFEAPRNVTYAHYATNKVNFGTKLYDSLYRWIKINLIFQSQTSENETVFIRNGGIGQDMVEFCLRVENPFFHCYNLQVYGFEDNKHKCWFVWLSFGLIHDHYCIK